MQQPYNFNVIIPKFDAILERGLCSGVGDRNGQMCIEAAICAVLDEPHGDEPSCVEPAVRSFKIKSNDSPWSSPSARAKGLRAVGIAQIGSKGVINGNQFSKRVAELTIRELIPKLLREVVKTEAALEAAERCEKEGTAYAAAAATFAAAAAATFAAAAAATSAAAAADAAAYATYAATSAAAAAADAAAYAAAAAAKKKETPTSSSQQISAYVF